MSTLNFCFAFRKITDISLINQILFKCYKNEGMLGVPVWLSHWVSAFRSGDDPRALGLCPVLSPAVGLPAQRGVFLSTSLWFSSPLMHPLSPSLSNTWKKKKKEDILNMRSSKILFLFQMGHLTLEDYQIWSVKNVLANEFLNLLFQVCLR